MPPVQLTEEEQAKFDERLKELGYDANARDTLARREALLREAQAKIKQYEPEVEEAKRLKAEALQRKADEDKVKAEEADRKKREEDEKKSSKEQLEAMEKRIADRLAEEEKKREADRKQTDKELKERDDKIAARDKRLLSLAVKAAAKERGILDDELVALIDASSVKVEDGVFDDAEVQAVVEKHATDKPHLYRPPQQRGDDGRFTRPDPNRQRSGNAGTDWSKLSDAEFAAKEAELRRFR